MDLTKFDKPLSELAWDIIQNTTRANAFLAVAEYLEPLKIHDYEKAKSLGLELIPLVSAGLKEYRKEMYKWDDESEAAPISGVVVKEFSTLDLASRDSEAYNSLPEAYQADDVMIFYYDVNGNLCGSPKESEKSVVGDWEVMYNPETKEWEQTE